MAAPPFAARTRTLNTMRPWPSTEDVRAVAVSVAGTTLVVAAGVIGGGVGGDGAVADRHNPVAADATPDVTGDGAATDRSSHPAAGDAPEGVTGDRATTDRQPRVGKVAVRGTVVDAVAGVAG